MDLDNQNSATANTNTDSAANDFGAPVSFVDQSEGMNAINEAIAATSDAGASPAAAFDINDISLDNVPSSQDELDQQLRQDPNMSLAGGAASTTDAATDPVAAVNPTLSALTANAAEMNGEDPATAEKPATPSASFVSGDIIDEAETPSEQKTEAPKQYDNINSDPLANFETTPIDQAATQADPANSSAASAEAPATTPSEQPAPAADAITVPGRKSKTPIIIAVSLIAVVAIVGVVIFLVTRK